MSPYLEEYLSSIEDCEARQHRLSTWERDFISSIRSQIESGKSLSRKQTERLDEIWEKATVRG